MPDREKVIEGLNDIHAVACGLGDDECYLNSIGIKQLQTLINDATELLRAQEPQVLSVEAVRKLTRIPVWLDVKSTHKDLYRGWVLAYMVQKGMGITGERLGMADPSGRMHWYKLDDYGRTWRIWDSDPTDAQKEATPWQG